MSDVRDNRIKEILRDMAARFLLENGNGSSLLTVTRVELSRRGKYATIFFTVFPVRESGGANGQSGESRENHDGNLEKTAVEFAKRKRSEFKQYVKDNSKLGIIPQLDFALDLGEKNRQKIDELLSGEKFESEEDVGEK